MRGGLTIDVDYNGDGITDSTISRTTDVTATGIRGEGGAVREENRLNQNYPNPFSTQTAISFDLARAEHVRVVVYDLLGREVAAPVNELRPSGANTVQLDASRLSAGVYIYRLETDGGRKVVERRMIVVR